MYDAGALVKTHLWLRQSGQKPLDVRVEADILENDTEVIDTLPPRALDQLITQGWTQMSWDSSTADGGEYAMEVRILGPNQILLDRARTEFQVGQAAGRITRLEVIPEAFALGDMVKLALDFDNTGSSSLDGSLVIRIQDASGEPVEEFRQEFTGLAPGSSLPYAPVWPEASLHPRNCRIVAYADFAGRTTAMSVMADESESPLRWEVISVSELEVELQWLSVAGRQYAVEATTDLSGVFKEVISGLEATPPRNSVILKAQGSKEFYRLREEILP